MSAAGHQKDAFEETYQSGDERWAFHYTADPLIRFLRDRRLTLGLRVLRGATGPDVDLQSVLVVCGGVGGEGTFFRKSGFDDVTVSDFSNEALERCRRFDPELKTLLIDAEDMQLPDSAYDVVIVQDGLHHLPRPPLGFAEMLRVARVGVIVIEPYRGLVGRLLGREWEVHGSAVNYVFRWDANLIEQCTRSYLLSRETQVIVTRIWDHNVAIGSLVKHLPMGLRVHAAKMIYAALSVVSRIGNMMVAVILKDDAVMPERLTSH